MASTTTAATTQLEMGNIPKGNWIARNLRLLNQNSKELFPKTPAEHKAGKFHSMYRKDFNEYPTEVLLEGLAPKGKQPDRETIRDVLFGQSPTSPRQQPPKYPLPPAKACLLPPDPDEQDFASWRIPNRISGGVEQAKIGDHVGVVAPEKVETPAILRPSSLPAIPAPDSGKVKIFTPQPRITAAQTFRELQQQQQKQQPAGPAKKIQRSKTTLDPPSVPPVVPILDIKGAAWTTTTTTTINNNNNNNDHNRFKARMTQWQERLPDVDPRLLHKVMRLHEQQEPTGVQQKLRGTVLPDARKTVQHWLESATEVERLVALQFFNSLAGGRLMGGRGPEQNARLRDVIDALQNPGGRWLAEAGLSPRGGPFGINMRAAPQNKGAEKAMEGSDEAGVSKRLRYVGQLDPDTRRKRWMHTSWHHLPQYQPTSLQVTNSSSHYVRPQQYPHRHFVIHPDWPPQ